MRPDWGCKFYFVKVNSKIEREGDGVLLDWQRYRSIILGALSCPVYTWVRSSEPARRRLLEREILKLRRCFARARVQDMSWVVCHTFTVRVLLIFLSQAKSEHDGHPDIKTVSNTVVSVPNITTTQRNSRICRLGDVSVIQYHLMQPILIRYHHPRYHIYSSTSLAGICPSIPLSASIKHEARTPTTDRPILYRQPPLRT